MNLVVNDTSFSYKDYTIFDSINLMVSKGEFICLVGANGSGKSTLSNILSGKKGYDVTGEVLFENNDLPGIMSANSISTYLERFGVIAGDDVVLYTNNDYSYQMVFDLLEYGINVNSVIDVRKSINEIILKRLRENNVKIILEHEIIKAFGNKHINEIQIRYRTYHNI